MLKYLNKDIEYEICKFLNYTCSTCNNKLNSFNMMLYMTVYGNKIYCCNHCFNHT